MGDGAAADFEGVPPELAERMRADLDRRREDVEVWPENHEAVTVFSRCMTQWRHSFGGGPVGLDYVGTECVMRLCGVADPADCFERIQIMEYAALAALRE